jgi:predicted XRE-type DNA-binding protein
MVSGMIQRYHDLESDGGKLRRLTGLTLTEFETLHSVFKDVWKAYFSQFTLDGTPRARQASVRRNSIFGETKDALLFGLIYLNAEIRQDQLATFFGIDQPKASKYLFLIQKMLKQALETNPRGIPKRKKELILKTML